MKVFLWVAMLCALLLTAWLQVGDLGRVNRGQSASTAVVNRAVQGRDAAERSAREMEKNLERKLAE